MKRIKVLVIDDSPLIRALLTEVLQQAKDIEVVGVAEDPFEAREKIKQLNPDVLTLDVEMPKMNGIAFLRNLMRLRPMPVVMVSTLTKQGAPVTLEALEIGAVDFLAKPSANIAQQFHEYAQELHDKIRAAAKANMQSSVIASAPPAPQPVSSGDIDIRKLVAIGASTGGTEAIKEVLIRLPERFPPVVITQHIPASFSTSFAERMDRLSRLKVYEAQDNQAIEAGCVYIAPGDDHLSIVKSGSGLKCRLSKAEPVNRHRPAVDVLFNSVAEIMGKNAIGVLLTGMGADGAKGLLAMKQAGAYTIAQDEASSIVWGMPKAAVDLGAAQRQVNLFQCADLLIQLLKKSPKI